MLVGQEVSSVRRARVKSVLVNRGSRRVKMINRISQLRRTIRIDTQQMRLKTMGDLKELFDMAAGLARGDFGSQLVEGKQESISVKERQKWVRVAAYTAQVLNSITDKFDEREVDRELAELEKLVDEASAKGKAAEGEEGAQQEEEPARPAEGQG